MIRGTLNFVVWCVGVAVIAYVVFFIPLGERTMFEHASRIWATPEAREMQSEVKDAAGRATTHVKQKINEQAAEKAREAESLKTSRTDQP